MISGVRSEFMNSGLGVHDFRSSVRVYEFRIRSSRVLERMSSGVQSSFFGPIFDFKGLIL